MSEWVSERIGEGDENNSQTIGINETIQRSNPLKMINFNSLENMSHWLTEKNAQTLRTVRCRHQQHTDNSASFIQSTVVSLLNTEQNLFIVHWYIETVY